MAIPSCSCPPGFEFSPDGSTCIQTTTADATAFPTASSVCSGNNVSAYGSLGSRFYESTLNRPLPISSQPQITPTHLEDAIGGTLQVVNTKPGTDTLWGSNGGSITGRLNQAGVWTCPGDDIQITGQWIGFTTCITLNEDTTYYVGIAGYGPIRIKLTNSQYPSPGQTVANLNVDSAFNYNYWHVIPITLKAGVNILHLEIYNNSFLGAFGAEIYNVDLATLLTFTTPAQLQAVTVFSTLNRIGSQFDTGQTTGNFCPDGYTLTNCEGELSCALVQSSSPSCCFQLIDCADPQNTILTTTDLTDLLGKVIKISGYDECWTVLTGPCDQPISRDVQINTSTSVILTSAALFLPGDVGSSISCNRLAPGTVILSVNSASSVTISNPIVSAGSCIASITTIVPASPVTVVAPLTGYASCELCTPPPCWTITECNNPSNTLNIQNDLSQYADSSISIQISSYGSTCWQVTESVSCNLSISLPIGFTITSFTDATDSCLLCDPICYILTACEPFNTHSPLKLTNDLSGNIGDIVKINAVGFEELCWTVSLADDCINSFHIPDLVVTVFVDCFNCHPTKAYILTDCNTEDPNINSPITVSTNLAGLIGKTINQVVIETLTIDPDTCWNVTELGFFDGGFEATYNPEFYQDCVCCLPKVPEPPKPPPVKIIPDPVRIFYKIEEGECDINANKRFGEGYSKLVKKIRYGISSCCEGIDFSQLWLKKQLSDLSKLVDPNYCPQQINACFPNPCNTINTCCQTTKCTTCSPCTSCSPGFSQFPCQEPTADFPGQMCYTNVLISDFLPCDTTPETLNQFTFSIGGVILNTPVDLDCILSKDDIQTAIIDSLLDSTTSTVIITSFDSNGANFFIQKIFTTPQDQVDGCVDMDGVSSCNPMLCSLLDPSCGFPIPESNYWLWNGTSDFFLQGDGSFWKIF